ncbi:MAG: 4-alpha-glucanotransferase [Steroidobacteraceae bacterium]
MNPTLIERLARLRGIGDAYHDHRGELRHFSLETRRGLLRAMGCEVTDEAGMAAQVRDLEAARNRGLLPPVAVADASPLALEVNVTARDFGASLLWELRLEDGREHRGVASTAAMQELWRGEIDGVWMTRRRFELPVELPHGLHDVHARLSGGPVTCCRLVVAPPRCHLPAALESGKRAWGIAVQLYTLRSDSNWGIGDFGDLATLVRWLAPLGADFIALNPLHALAPADPQRASPYSASNCRFLNVLYIDVPAVPEFGECAAAIERSRADDFQMRLGQLRDADLVDYRGVAALKLPLLRLLHARFREHHLEPADPRARAFLEFVEQGGEALRLHALFDALDERVGAGKGGESGWQNWPAEYASPTSDSVRRFAREHAIEIEFFLYLQWLAQEQLRGCQMLARDAGMGIGLYGDYAVGAHPSGSEVWSSQEVFRLGAEIGAPPDPLALRGQGWGLPPQDPSSLQAARLAPFVDLMDANMRHFGALRLDHVMALFRQWWVPAGQSPAEGAYVHYPLHELMAVLCLASERHRCLVVGEDLGVVPDEIRAAMHAHRLLHYKVLLFEKSGEQFRRPRDYEHMALATPCTHDMPTLCSYWEGRDIDLRSRLNLYPDEQVRDALLGEREHDRHALLAALRAEGLAPPRPQDTIEPFDPALAMAVHEYLARSASMLVAVQIEDLLGMAEPVNVPGTWWQYPNWQRKLTAGLEQICSRDDIREALARIEAARRRS